MTTITMVSLAIPSLATAKSNSYVDGIAPVAQPEPLLLSNDGTVWGTTLPEPLFDAAHRYVPGEVLESGFWILNNSGHPALYTVQATNVNMTTALAGTLSMTVGGDGLTSAPLTNCLTMVRNTPIAAGERLYIQSAVSLSEAAPLDARNQVASFGIGTTLHDAPLTIADGQCLDDTDNTLPPIAPIDTDPPSTQTPAPPTTETAPSDGSGSSASQAVSAPASQLALTGAYLGIWALLAAALSVGGILIGFRKRKATHE
ncbi:hypothetical protein [Lysinibacter cavernae]|uniref:LPXTG cell wall anchor domain-containing protein n=1 Tax=Lysinibacter cavernae TaxID=1640652 RepID=A0A7X5R0M9_9MICO|nr:hypothetical protein [Lysinibacter cavernae]NIH53282.1 hypothetical protein [Lysinibacter cavernae]